LYAVRLAPESVFDLPWNQCSAWSGISVRLGAEYALDTYSHAIPAMQEEAATLIADLVYANHERA